MSKTTGNRPRIMVTGKMRSGKTTISDYLYYQYNLKPLAFGDALKQSAEYMFFGNEIPEYKFEPITWEIPFSSDVEIVDYRKPRKLLQDYGQLMRSIDPDVWVRKLDESVRIWESMEMFDGVVVHDGRQPNEFEWAKENGFTIIRVSANEDYRLERAKESGDNFTVKDLRHETEQHVDDIVADYDIFNGGSIDELKRKIDAIMAEVVYDGGKDSFYNVK